MNLSPESRYPCLLDRLAGLAGDRPSPLGVTTAEGYRRAILRDLRWLLDSRSFLRTENAANGGPPQPTELYSQNIQLRQRPHNPEGYRYPQAIRSTVNYGLCKLEGSFVHGAARQMEEELQTTILAFEPRFRAVKVIVHRGDGAEPGKLVFTIQAELQPLPGLKTMTFRSAYDLETGGCEVTIQA